jgi:hypothetical protein
MLNQTVCAIASEDVRFQPNTIYYGNCEYILKQFRLRWCYDVLKETEVCINKFYENKQIPWRLPAPAVAYP